MRARLSARAALLAPAIAIAALSPSATSAAEANTLSISAVLENGRAIVTGTVRYTEVAFQPLGEEARGDDVTKGAGLGGDLRGFAFHLEPDGDLVARWSVDLFAPTTGIPGWVYGVAFVVEGQGWELDAARVTTESTSAPRAHLWKCAGTCSPSDQTFVGTVPATFDPASATVTATIPAERGVARRGDLFEPASVGKASAFVDPGFVSWPYAYGVNDWLDEEWALFVPGVRVDLEVGPPGIDPSQLYFVERASLEGSAYSASIPARPGDVVYARACSGASCWYAASSPLG